MERFFVRPTDDENIRINGDDYLHAVRVLRLKEGDNMELCDGAGRICVGRVTQITKQELMVRAQDWQADRCEPAHKISLFQCLPKAGKADSIVQKCVELGVHAIYPTLSARCVAQSANLPRLQRIAEEAAKQSKRGIIPRIMPQVKLSEPDFAAFDSVLLPYEGERGQTLKAVLRRGVGERIALIIGPEGGFEAQEVAALTAKGAQPLSLGPRILRTETAGPTALAQIMYEVEP